MKILLLSYRFYPSIGGIEIISESLATRFVRLGAEVHLITKTTEDDGKNFPFHVIRNPNLLNLLKEYFWADVILENHPALSLSWPLLLYRKPHIIVIQTWISKMDRSISLKDKIKSLWLHNANSVVAISRIIKNLTFPKAHVLGNPYNEGLFRRLPSIRRDKDFVFLGRLIADKGADMAIEILHLLHSDQKYRNRRFTLSIIGDGKELNRLKDMVERYNLKEYVSFTGSLSGDKLVEYLNRHKYLLVPSRWIEPFGIVALEGMACGCLPFVSDEGGLIDAIGNAGVSFKRNNINSMFLQIKEILDSPDLENSIRNSAKNHLQKYESELVAKKYLKLIGAAMGQEQI